MRCFQLPSVLLLPFLVFACSAENAEAPTPAEGGSADLLNPAEAGQEPLAETSTAGNEVSTAGVEASTAGDERDLREPTFDFAPEGPIPNDELGSYHVALACAVDGEDVGTLTLALWADAAPVTVRNFLRLCDVGFYDGLRFHRIMRDFMVQGGDPTGTGGGDSPFGTLPAEFSDAPERAHGYGVISMARVGGQPDSASCQFFLCCEESPPVWNLDGQYASFGRLTSGVATLEALANVPTGRGPTGEGSAPTQQAVITRAEVRKGAAPTGETIARPAPGLGGEPPKVVVQHVLVAVQSAQNTAVERTREEAEELAREILDEARGGADFAALVREHSNDTPQPDDETPGVYALRNRGVREIPAERSFFRARQRAEEEMQALSARVAAGEATQEELQARGNELVAGLMAAQEAVGAPREGMARGFVDVAFSLEVGEIGLVPHDPERAPYGWHVIKRLE